LHDVGLSGWWSLVVFVPLANIIFGLYALFAPGQEHDNDHGSSLTSKQASTPMSPASHVQIQESTFTRAATNAEVTTPLPEALATTVAEPKEEFWAQALHECDAAVMKAGLWAKSFADAGGDEHLAKATYMRLRSTQVQAQYDEQQQALVVARNKELLAEQEKQKILEAEEAKFLAELSEAERAIALLPKGKCPSCDAVIPLVAEECPKCKALFTAGSSWKINPLKRYEAIAQKALDDAVIISTRPSKDESAAEAGRAVVFVVALLLLVVFILVNANNGLS
jgi:predicted Zn-ribbon and HTH transcriptional regulator